MPLRLLSPVLELQALADNSVRPFVRAIEDLAAAVFDGRGEVDAREELQRVIGDTSALADLLGRRRLFLEFRAVRDRQPEDIPVLTFAAEAERLPRVPFLEAIRDLVSREPTLADNWRAVAELYQTKHAFALARSASLVITEKVRDVIQRFAREGVTLRKAEEVISRMGDWSSAYAETVFRTNLNTAYNNGRREQALEPDIAQVISAFELLTAGDGDVRFNHFAAHGLVAATTDEIWRLATPPFGYNCLLPDTRVSGRFLGGLESKYSGPAVEIQTQNGRRLRVTINHPIATTIGMIPARLLRKGHHCLTHLPTVESLHERDPLTGNPFPPRRTVHDQNGPAAAEKVIQSFAVERMWSVRAGWAPLNLHGDAKFLVGKVGLVGSYSRLALETSLRQVMKQIELVESASAARSTIHRASFLDSFAERNKSAGTGFPGGAALPDDILASEFAPLELFCCGPAANIYSPSLQSESEDVPADPEFVRELLERFPGEITPDEIINVKTFHWSGHVCDLETETGWMIAEGLAIGNCRCTIRGVDRFELKRRGLVDRSGFVRQFLPRNFAAFKRDPGFETRLLAV